MPLGLESFGNLGSQIFTGLAYTAIGLTVLALLGGAYWVLRVGWKRYDIEVRIYSKRKNGYKTWTDKGAYLKNKKTGEVYGFKLKNDKTLLQPPPFEMLMPSTKGNTLHLVQMTSDEYFVLDPVIDIGEQLAEGETKEGKTGFLKLKVIEGDIQLWATQMIDKLYSMYDRKGFWDKYGAFIMFGAAAIMVIVLIYIFLQKFDVMKEVAANLAEAAKALREVKASGALVSVGG